MIYQDQLQGIIYLENSLIKGAFTNQKLTVLQALLAQVSISIANAQLYKDLEDHASVQKSLKQKEVLLKEIHHRVKNNLFVVSTLLDFQSNYVDDPQIIKLLENCQNRITAMAMVHQHLYGHSELDRINFAHYIESLLDNLAYSQGSKERNINLILDLEPIELNIESANPCGLIVNELISNALEHAFDNRAGYPGGNRSSGNIWLKLKHNSANQVVLTVQDDGIGFKPGLDLYNSDSLGLELVCTLVEQLEGEIELDQTQGTKIEIAFHELNYGSRI
jgi:two-component sensor histidine kinase